MVSRVIELNEEQRAALADLVAKKKNFIAMRNEAMAELKDVETLFAKLVADMAAPLAPYEEKIDTPQSVSADLRYIVVLGFPGTGEQS